MGLRKIVVKQSAAESIAAIAWFIESKGMLATADKFTDDVYDILSSCRITGSLMQFAGNPKEQH